MTPKEVLEIFDRKPASRETLEQVARNTAKLAEQFIKEVEEEERARRRQ